MKPTLLACAVAALFSPALYAAEAAEPDTLEPVVVTADRNAQTLDKAAPNVAVIGRKTLNQAAAANIDDIALYEPGVEVASDNSRRGHAGFPYAASAATAS